jgi:hypothetical protein
MQTSDDQRREIMDLCPMPNPVIASAARVSAAIPGVVSADGLPACRSAHAGYDLKDEHPGRRPPALRKPWAKENNRASQCVYLKCK